MKTNSVHFKNLISTFSMMGILLSAPAIFGQTPNSANQDEPTKRELKFPKNNFKINLSSLAFKNYSLYYERSLSRKISFSAGYRTMPSNNLGQLPLIKMLNDKINGGMNTEDNPIDDINRMTASGNAYTGEFRFYSGKKPGARGFYISLYGRYATFNHDYDYRFTENNDNTISIPIKSKVTGTGIGFSLGKQLLIAKRVTLDVSYIGGHYGKLSGTSQGPANLNSLSNTDRQTLKDDLDNILVINKKSFLTTTVNDQGIAAKINGPFAGVRMGISLGIAF